MVTSVSSAVRDPRVVRSLQTMASSTVNQKLFDRGLRHAMLFEGLKQTEVNKTVRYLNSKVFPDITNTLRKRLERAKKLGLDRGPWTTRYYKDMVNETLGMVRGGMAHTSKQLTAQLTKIGYAEAQFAGDALSDSLPFNFSPRAPSMSMIQAVVKNSPVHGKLIPTWFSDLGESVQGRIVQQINLGLVVGDPTDKIIRRLTGPGGVFHAARRDAETLVRTQMTHVSSKARELTYEQNAEVIKGVRYVATLDARTTDICAGLDGQVFKPTEGPRPPMHMRCRSTTIPVTKSWKELGEEFKIDAFKNMKEGQSSGLMRSSMNGRVPAKTTYNAWLKTQPKAFQDQVLGPRRAAIFQRGNLHLSRFTNYGTFPPQPLTVNKLLKLEKAITAGKASGGAVPFSAVLKPKPKPKLKPKPKPRRPNSTDQIDGGKFERIGPQQGSNPGGVFRDPKTGEEWYLKFPANEEIARNEVLAARLYKEAGANVPDVRLVVRNGKTGVASKMKKGVRVDKSTNKSGLRAAGAADDFVTDAWLANWDVVGLEYDNMLISRGRVIRLDTGGALRFRAQGQLKGLGQFGDTVGELESMVSGLNPQAATVFGEQLGLSMMDDVGTAINRLDALIRGIDKVKAVTPDRIKALVRTFGPKDPEAQAELLRKILLRRGDLMRKQKVFQAQRKQFIAKQQEVAARNKDIAAAKERLLGTDMKEGSESLFLDHERFLLSTGGDNRASIAKSMLAEYDELRAAYKRDWVLAGRKLDDLPPEKILSRADDYLPPRRTTRLEWDEWIGTLDGDELEAIRKYTDEDYGIIRAIQSGRDSYWNQYGKKLTVTASQQEEFGPMAKKLGEALARSEKFSGQAYRGMKWMDQSYLEEVFEVGKVWTSEATTSFTTDLRTARFFQGTHKTNISVRLEVEFKGQGVAISERQVGKTVRKGQKRRSQDVSGRRNLESKDDWDPSDWLSEHREVEHEVLLEKGAQFRVVSIEKDEWLWVIKIEPL